MRAYIGAKIIQAREMDQAEWASYAHEKYGRDVEVKTCHPPLAGYLVRYPDGYTSWSPKREFELAYREIRKEEADLVEYGREPGE